MQRNRVIVAIFPCSASMWIFSSSQNSRKMPLPFYRFFTSRDTIKVFVSIIRIHLWTSDLVSLVGSDWVSQVGHVIWVVVSRFGPVSSSGRPHQLSLSC